MKPTLSEYITTDLHLQSHDPFDVLVTALTSSGAVEFGEIAIKYSDAGSDVTPRYWINLNAAEVDEELVEECRHLRSPQKSIDTMLDGIEKLTGAAKSFWDALVVREFNMGFNVGEETPTGCTGFQGELSTKTLARIVAVNATLAWTLYPAES